MRYSLFLRAISGELFIGTTAVNSVSRHNGITLKWAPFSEAKLQAGGKYFETRKS